MDSSSFIPRSDRRQAIAAYNDTPLDCFRPQLALRRLCLVRMPARVQVFKGGRSSREWSSRRREAHPNEAEALVGVLLAALVEAKERPVGAAHRIRVGGVPRVDDARGVEVPPAVLRDT